MQNVDFQIILNKLFAFLIFYAGKAGGTSQQVSASARIVMVYFLGGCTFSEIAALRFLAKHRGWDLFIGSYIAVVNEFL